MTKITKSQNIDTPRKCNSCCQPIEPKAKVCHHCGQPQKCWQKLLRGSPIAVSIVMMVIATVQLILAFSERIDASDALKKAENALAQVLSDANSIAKLKEEISYFSLVTKASNDDRTSFFELYKISMTDNHAFQIISRRAVEQILSTLTQIIVINRDVVWQKYKLDPEKASLADFGKVYEQVPLIYKTIILQTAWDQERFSKAEKLEVLYEIIAKTQSLRVLDLACELMDKEAKLNKNILAYKEYIKWWEENREKYNKNPENQPTDSND